LYALIGTSRSSLRKLHNLSAIIGEPVILVKSWLCFLWYNQ